MKLLIKSIGLTLAIACHTSFLAAQQEKTVINDVNTPLHLLKPDYKNPYGEVTKEEIKVYLDRVLDFLEASTPARIVNKNTKEVITDYKKLDKDSEIERGNFRLSTYEWGVTYSAMLEAAQATGDTRFEKYVADRFVFIAEIAPYFRQLGDNKVAIDRQMRQILYPHALDDAGAICASMIKYQLANPDAPLRYNIENYMDYIMNKEYRLSDGTFARKRPQMNTLWLDDMYMSIPAIAYMGKLTGDNKYYDEAVKQVLLFSEKMFVKDKNLYMHGWVEGVDYHPAFHWGRANGWAILTMTEVLDALPESHPGRAKVMEQFKAHLRGIAPLQSSEGFWHQLLDRNDSYLETSATAIFVYCIARAINNGWIDAISYGPVAQLGWNAVTTKITQEGHVQDVCVGTGMAFDPAFYYYRPVNIYAAHGYGPVLMAGAEMINLLNKYYPRMNDSAIQYYSEDPKNTSPIFGMDGTNY